jgi:hypothetical protein
VRVEFNPDKCVWVNTDNRAPVDASSRPQITVDEYCFINMQSPYAAIFILDKELAHEYTATRSFDRLASSEVVNYHIRERAAMGLTFENVPAGFRFRYVVPYSNDKSVPHFCWVHHTTNRFARAGGRVFGKVPMNELLI